MSDDPIDRQRRNALIEDTAGEILVVLQKMCGKENPALGAAVLFTATSAFLAASGIDPKRALESFAETLEFACGGRP